MKFFTGFIAIVVLIQNSSAKPLVENDQIVFEEENALESSEILETDSTGVIEEKANMNLESGGFFQGDIVLSPDQEDLLSLNATANDHDLESRTGILLESQRWTKDKAGFAVLPYIIKTSDYTANQQTLIKRAMEGIEKYTCVRFTPRTTERDYVEIKSGSGCHSNLGKIGGKQEVSLKNAGCMKNGIVQHELIHALGYDHMHSHFDRDKFVTIKWENIREEAADNFGKVNPKIFGNFNTAYDLSSVMHYPKNAFSKNGKDTIVATNRMKALMMGQRIGLSSGDAKRVNNMYQCSPKNIQSRKIL